MSLRVKPRRTVVGIVYGGYTNIYIAIATALATAIAIALFITIAIVIARNSRQVR